MFQLISVSLSEIMLYVPCLCISVVRRVPPCFYDCDIDFVVDIMFLPVVSRSTFLCQIFAGVASIDVLSTSNYCTCLVPTVLLSIIDVLLLLRYTGTIVHALYRTLLFRTSYYGGE
jgi:hypothetical protein